jgi:hypothetical protein
MSRSALSAFKLIITDEMIDHIKICTELEARQILKNEDWVITDHQIYSFLAILYVRGAYESNNLKASYLWSIK